MVDHNPALYRRARRDLAGVTVLENLYAQGVSGNRNTGAFHTHTALIAFMDDDVVAEPDWLGRLVAPFADPTGRRHRRRDQPGVGGTRRRAGCPTSSSGRSVARTPACPPSTAPIRNVWSASMVVRRETFMAVGGFRTGFGKLGGQNRPEDTELCMRMSARRRRPLDVRAGGGHPPRGAGRAASTFSFFLRRCYAEGRGKVQMAGLNARTGQPRRRTGLPAVPAPGRAPQHRRRPRPGRRARPARPAACSPGVAAAGFGGAVETISTRRTGPPPGTGGKPMSTEVNGKVWAPDTAATT